MAYLWVAYVDVGAVALESMAEGGGGSWGFAKTSAVQVAMAVSFDELCPWVGC